MARRTPLERWNGLAWVCTPLAMEKGEWTCWGLYGMAMERSCSLWRRREFWDHSVPPNTTRSTRLSLCGCDLTTSISSPRTSYGNKGESAQTDDLPRQPSKKYSTEADVSLIVVTCSRIHQGMDPDGLENGCSPQKKSPKKPINRMCLGEESTDDSTQSGNSTTGQRQRGPPRSTAMG